MAQDFQVQIDNLQRQINQLHSLNDIYYRTHSIDKEVFQNPVTFNSIVRFPYRKILQRTVTTTTATTTALHTSTLGLYGDGLMYVTAVINGKNGTAKYGTYTVKAVIKFVFGAATVLASTVTAEYETDASWDVTVTASGNNYLINVVSSADTIIWRATVEEYI